MHAAAKAQIKECYEKNKSGDPQFRSLITSTKARLRSTVGEHYWTKAHDYQDDYLKQMNKRVQQEGQVQQQQQQQQIVLSPCTHRGLNPPPAAHSPAPQSASGQQQLHRRRELDKITRGSRKDNNRSNTPHFLHPLYTLPCSPTNLTMARPFRRPSRQPPTDHIHEKDDSVTSYPSYSTEDMSFSSYLTVTPSRYSRESGIITQSHHSSFEPAKMMSHGPEPKRHDAHPKRPPREDGNWRRRIRLWHRREQPFWKVTVAQVFCAIYIIVLTFSTLPMGLRDPITNDIIDPNSIQNTNNGVIHVNGSYRPVVAVGNWQKICLTISRASAFSMYPMMVVVFVTKMKATQCFLSRTPLSMYFGIIYQAHEHHAHAGAYLAFDVWIHALCHVLRWASQGNLKLLWSSAAGISGITVIVATPLITLPMMYYKDRLSYEIRKG
jgi:hypothetical protein